MRTEYLRRYGELFVHRRDVHARQTRKGTYYLVREPVNLRLIEGHLAGRVTCGFYALDLEDTVRWVCIDADRADGLQALKKLAGTLKGYQIPSYIEGSRRGGHLWVFFDEPIRAKVVRRLMSQLISSLELEDLEIYPKQDSLSKLEVGSLVRGPLGVHRLSGKRYSFLDPDGLTPVGSNLREQLDYLMTVEKASMATVSNALVDVLDLAPQAPKTSFPDRHGDIALIKERIDIYDFVSRYVQLDKKGRGCCPFHDDHRPSFSVNREEGYWNCFAGCGGGDVIHFYEKIRGISRGQAIRELAEQCGVVLASRGGERP